MASHMGKMWDGKTRLDLDNLQRALLCLLPIGALENGRRGARADHLCHDLNLMPHQLKRLVRTVRTKGISIHGEPYEKTDKVVWTESESGIWLDSRTSRWLAPILEAEEDE